MLHKTIRKDITECRWSHLSRESISLGLVFSCAVAASPEEIFFWLNSLQERLSFLNFVMLWEDFFFFLIST